MFEGQYRTEREFTTTYTRPVIILLRISFAVICLAVAMPVMADVSVLYTQDLGR